MVEFVHAFSWRGERRKENQDAICCSNTTFALADGIGGLIDGASAANLAVTLAVEICDKAIAENSFCTNVLEKVFTDIHARVVADYPDSGTTLNIVIKNGTEIHFAHVGDGRTYICIDRKWNQIGSDQNLAVQTGMSVNSSILTNYLGKRDFESPKPTRINKESCSAIIITSDGFYNSVDVGTIEAMNIDHKRARQIEQRVRIEEPEDDYSAILLN